MRLQRWIYVADQGCEDAESTLDLADRVAGVLDEHYEQREMAGFQVVPLLSEDDLDEQGVDPRVIFPGTGGRLPTVAINVTFDLDVHGPGSPELDEMLRSLGLVRTITDQPVGD